MKINHHKHTFIEGYPGYRKVTVSDEWLQCEPPQSFIDVIEEWSDEDNYLTGNFFLKITVGMIEKLGGFVCLPVDCPVVKEQKGFSP